MEMPEGATTVTSEGNDLKVAIKGAAEELGVHPQQVDYKLDLSHFRSSTGVSVARNTVRIIAWGTDRPVVEESERPERTERAERTRDRDDRGRDRDRDRDRDRGRDRDRDRDRDRGRDRDRRDAEASGDGEGRKRRRRRRRGDRDDRDDRSERSERSNRKPERLLGAEAGETEASAFAQEWFATLMKHMDIEGKVVGTGNEQRVHLAVTAERAGRIIGKRGSTLGAIRHVLGLAVENRFGALTIDVDVDDDRPAEERERGRRSERSERSDRRGRSRGGSRGDRGRYPEEKLRALARRAAEKARETKQTITINLELNSYDRRIVHLEVAEMEGVNSISDERESLDADGNDVRTKFIQVVPVDGGDSEE